MSDAPLPFDPENDFDAIADFTRKEVARVALRVTKFGAYKRADAEDQIQGYIAGLMVGSLGAIIAVTKPGSEAEIRALVRKHLNYWFDRGCDLNQRPSLGDFDA